MDNIAYGRWSYIIAYRDRNGFKNMRGRTEDEETREKLVAFIVDFGLLIFYVCD
jgi:hypothetical protein